MTRGGFKIIFYELIPYSELWIRDGKNGGRHHI
jgi:hypothetical protein